MIASPSRFASVIALALVALLRSAAAADVAPWTPDLGNGSYQNPVLFADYSDPDAVRVGDDFWLVSSSFAHAPGLPILHSRDLVNWTIVNHALPALVPAEHFNTVRHGEGVWAPAIRHHDGRFWIYYPDPDFGIYVVTATDPRGAWSAPTMVKAGRGLIDPCPLWDEDGKLYLVHGWARSRAGKSNLLTLNELSADGTRVLDGDGTVIIDENTAGRGITTLEGPKLYRHGGYYWIFAPVGGVGGGTQAVYRAKNLRGPYESRIVLAQGSTPINGPHQGAWVDTPTGENWFLHFQDRGAYGRIVHLEPMAWGEDGWPRMGTGVATGAEKGEPVLVHAKPHVPSQPIATPATSDEFNAPTLGLQWQWQANPRPDFFSLSARRGFMRLAAIPLATDGDFFNAPNLLLQKFPAPSFTATTVLDSSALDENSDAGLMVFGYGYAWIGVHRDDHGVRLRYAVNIEHVPRPAGGMDFASGITVDSKASAPVAKIFLRVTVTANAKYRFSYSEDGEHFTEMNAADPFQATVARWVGAKVGVFAATRSAAASAGHADFDWFRVTP